MLYLTINKTIFVSKHKYKPNMKKLFILISISCILSIRGTFAQVSLQDPLPQDTATIVGKLPNGITYYIRHNEEPKDRASFYIIRNAGALLENDDQDGLAHFLEHMAFQGTKNFPGKGIITTMERYGVAFGENVNAYTSQNETVYNLSHVPTGNEALLDTCLMILHDWSYYLTLDDKEIDDERGVISEEWRTRRNAGFRMQKQLFPVMFKDSKYAVRDVIGSLDVIRNFDYQTIRDFYHKWYRTDLEAIAIAGDFDVKRMEQRIKEIFSTIPAIENPEPRPFFEIPAHDEIYFAVATDKEAQSSNISILTILPDTPADRKNTHAYLKDNIVTSLYNSMVRTRIGEIMQQAEPPFLGASIGFGSLARGYNAYSISTTAKPNMEELALETILTENERIKRHGFAESELERTKTNMLTGLESAFKDRDKTDNESFIGEMQSHFLEQEPMVDFEYYYRFAKQLIPTITVEEVNAKAGEWNTGKNMVITITGPSEDTRHLTREEALAIMDRVAHAAVDPYHDTVNSTDLITGELPGSKIVKTKSLPQFDAVEWTLGNGAKVIFRKADYEKDAVSLSSYSKGGTSLYDVDMLPSADNAAGFTAAFGIGDFDAITLQKVLTGKMVSCGVSIGGMSESVSGASTPQDFETMLQLLYLRFEKPRFDKEVFASIINRQEAMLPNITKNPQKIMQDSVKMIMSNYNRRSLIYNEEYLKQIDLSKIEQIYRDRIRDASDFTFFIVGNIGEDTVRPLVEKYIGSLKSEYRNENWRDNKVRGPKGKTVKEIELKMETPKATVITNFSKEMKYSVYNNICNNILGAILEIRYTEKIREKEGGTYGVGVQPGATREPYSSYSMTMSFDCDPEKSAHLKSLIYAETEEMTQQPPTQEELGKVVSNMLKNREQSKNHNSYWLNAIYSFYVSGLNPADPKNFEDIINKITPKDIQKFAQSLFKGADVVDVTFKPKQ